MSKRGIFKFGLYDIPANCVLQHQDIFGNTTVLSPGVKTVFGYVRKRYMDVVNRNFDNIIVRNEYNQDLIFDFSLSYKIAGGLKNDDEDSKLYQKSVDKYASEEKEIAAEDWLKIHQEEISKNSHFTHVAEQLNYSDKKNWSEHHPIREYLKYEDEIEDEIFNEERNIQSEPGILRNTIQNAVRDIFVNSDYYDLTNISSNDEKVKKLYKNLKRDFFKMGLQLEDLNLKNIRMNNNYIEHSINSNISLNEKILKKEKKVVDTGFEYAELPPISIYREYPNGEPSGEVNFEHISRKEFIVMNKKGDKIIPLDDIQDEDVKKDAFDETIKDIFGDKTKDNNNNNNDCDNCPVIKENEELREANKKLEEDNNAMADDNYDLTLINKKLNEQVEDTLSDNTRILVDSDIIENNNLALVKENEKYVNENHELSVENDKLNTKVLELKRQLKNYSIKNVKLLVEQDEMENTNLVLANKVEELETANEATTKEKEELNNQLNEALSKNAQLLVEQDEKDNINNELANKVEELTATNEATTKEKEELNNQLNEALSKKTQLLVEQDEMDNNNYALANKVEELETENEVIIKEKEILNNQLGEALSKNAKILVEKEEIENINHELMEEIKKKETENELLRTGNVFITAQLNQTFTIHKQKTATEVDNLYLENEVNKLSELVKNQDEVIYDLSIANYEMENANIEKDKTIASLNSKNTDLSMELADKAELDKRVVATEMDNMYLEKDNDELTNKTTTQDEVIYDLAIANYEMENANIEKDKTIASLNSKNTDLSMELADKAELDKRVVATEMDNMYLEKDNDELTAKTTTQDEVIYDLSIANYDLENEIKDAHEVISSLSESNKNYVLESKENANKYAKLLAKKENIANKYSNAKKENNNLKEYINKLEQDNELLKQEKENNNKLRKTIKLNGKTSEVIKKAVANKNKLVLLTEENEVLKEQLKEFETRAINAEMDNMYLEKDNDELASKTTTQDEVIYDLAITNYDLHNDLDETLTQNADLEEANESKSGIISALEDETDNLKDKFKQEVDKNKELIKKQNELVSKIAKKDNEKADLNNKIKTLETNNKELANKNEKVIAANDELVEEITKADKDIKDLKDKLQNVDKSKTEMQENIDSLKAKGKELQKKLAKSEEQNKKLKAENEEQKEKEKILKQANANLKEEKEKAERENKEVKEKLEDASIVNKELVENLYDTNDKLVESEKKNVAKDEEIENLKAKIESQKVEEPKETKSTIKNLKFHKINLDRIILVKSNNFSKKYNIKLCGNLGCEEKDNIDDVVNYMIRKMVYDKVKDEKDVDIKNLVIISDDIPSKMTISGSYINVTVSSKVKKI